MRIVASKGMRKQSLLSAVFIFLISCTVLADHLDDKIAKLIQHARDAEDAFLLKPGHSDLYVNFENSVNEILSATLTEESLHYIFHVWKLARMKPRMFSATHFADYVYQNVLSRIIMPNPYDSKIINHALELEVRGLARDNLLNDKLASDIGALVGAAYQVGDLNFANILKILVYDPLSNAATGVAKGFSVFNLSGKLEKIKNLDPGLNESLRDCLNILVLKSRSHGSKLEKLAAKRAFLFALKGALMSKNPQVIDYTLDTIKKLILNKKAGVIDMGVVDLIKVGSWNPEFPFPKAKTASIKVLLKANVDLIDPHLRLVPLEKGELRAHLAFARVDPLNDEDIIKSLNENEDEKMNVVELFQLAHSSSDKEIIEKAVLLSEVLQKNQDEGLRKNLIPLIIDLAKRSEVLKFYDLQMRLEGVLLHWNSLSCDAALRPN
jgi:hypothetical protein